MEKKAAVTEKTEHARFKHIWICIGVCVSMLAAIIFTCFYNSFEKQANANINNPLETMNNMTYIYQNCYVLYRDLYNRQNQTNLNYHQLYMEPAEEIRNSYGEDFLDRVLRIYEKDGIIPWTNEADVLGITDEMLLSESAFLKNIISAEEVQQLAEISSYLDAHMKEIEGNFGQLNAIYDFVIEDTVTGEVVTNLPSKEIEMNNQFFHVAFIFDENGNVSVDGEVRGGDETKLRKNANEVLRSIHLNSLVENNFNTAIAEKFMRLTMPKNCRVVFCISKTTWQQMQEKQFYEYYIVSDRGSFSLAYGYADAYRMTNSGQIYLLLLLFVVLSGLFMPKGFVGTPWKENKICRPALELIFIIGCVFLSLEDSVVALVKWVKCGDGIGLLKSFLPNNCVMPTIYIVNVLVLSLLFFAVWYTGICVRALRELGFKEYFKKHCAIYKIFPFIKKKALEAYDILQHFDVTKKANRMILKIVIMNGIILFVISSLWVGGFAIAIVYSVLLYFILRKYISDLQKKYGILLQATNEIAQGNLNVVINGDLGVFEPFKPQMIRIQEGFKHAVEEEVKSQRMKSELITNVSHDLKTPLTAIITYINLLQEENITEEQRREYITTLEHKSMRLKVLIEDLFEVSKANSNNITLNLVDVDIINLIKQVQFEMSDKLENANLDIRMSLPEKKCILSLDSQKTYRIFENLFANIAKYALPGTRVYIDGTILEDAEKGEYGIQITLKNITAEELQITPQELTERFVRGDVSRNTEGSGLGLAIAKSFTELQKGSFELQLDGDLFKVITVFVK